MNGTSAFAYEVEKLQTCLIINFVKDFLNDISVTSLTSCHEWSPAGGRLEIDLLWIYWVGSPESSKDLCLAAL